MTGVNSRDVYASKNLTTLFQVWRAFSENTIGVQVQIDLVGLIVSFLALKLLMIDLRVFEGEWAKVARIMVSIFIKQSNIINLKVDFKNCR